MANYNDLIQTAKDGDSGPLAERVLFHARAILKHKVPYQDIDDVVQEALAKMLVKLADLVDHDKFSGWLNTLICNCARDYWRDQYRYESKIEAHPGQPQITEETPERTAIDKERRQLLHDALRELPEHKCKVMQMFYIEHLSTKEISGKIGKADGTIRRWLHEARGTLEGQL